MKNSIYVIIILIAVSTASCVVKSTQRPYYKKTTIVKVAPVGNKLVYIKGEK